MSKIWEKTEYIKFGLKDRHYEELKALYFLYPNIEEIIIFGSRARGDYKERSDIDIAIKGNLSKLDIAMIREQLEESRIPYMVDVIEYNKIVDKNFKEEIDRDGIVLK